MSVDPKESQPVELTPFRLLFPTVELLVPSGTYLIGRERKTCDVVVPDDAVSKVHCAVTATPDSLTIRDLHSQNGVSINGQRARTQELREGDRVRIGRVRFHIGYEPAQLADVQQSKVQGTLNRQPVESASPNSDAVQQETSPRRVDLSRESIEISTADITDESDDEIATVEDPSNDLDNDIPSRTVALSDAEVQRELEKDREKPELLKRKRFAKPEVASQSPDSWTDFTFPGKDELLSTLTTTSGKLLIVIVVSWGIYGMASLIAQSRQRDVEIAERLLSFGEEIKQLRASGAPPKEWESLRKRVDPELQEMIAYLEEHASSENPESQNLLRAARDCLPKMLGMSASPVWHEEKFYEYLDEFQSSS